jgi:hypothetical protein
MKNSHDWNEQKWPLLKNFEMDQWRHHDRNGNQTSWEVHTTRDTDQALLNV